MTKSRDGGPGDTNKSSDGRPAGGANLKDLSRKSGTGRVGERKDCINRLHGVVAALLREGADPVLIMESLTAIRRNQDLPVTRFHRFTAAIAAASGMSLKELGQLDTWLHAHIADEKARAGEIPPSPSHIVLEVRKGPNITYRLKLVKCGNKSCRRCRQGPAHGPYWYAYGQGGGRYRQTYIGKTLDPQTLAATVIVTTE